MTMLGAWLGLSNRISCLSSAFKPIRFSHANNEAILYFRHGSE